MDLQLLAQACWRRRARLALAAVGLGLAFVVVGSVIIDDTYVASADVAVFPPAAVDDSLRQVYSLQPDRFVATQEAILTSQESAGRVATDLHLDPGAVAGMVKVTQVGESDVLRVTATSGDGDVSAKVASGIAQDYIDQVRHQIEQTYELALKSLDDQRVALDTQQASLSRQIAALGESTEELGLLQNRLNDVLSQSGSLATRRQELVILERTDPQNTRIVSAATKSAASTGRSAKTLFLYGAVLGLGLAICFIAVTTGPGRDLEGLATGQDLEGLRVIGVAEHPSALGRTFPWLQWAGGNRQVRNLAVAGEMRTLLAEEGRIVVVPVGNIDRVSSALECTNELIAEHRGDGWELSNGAANVEVVPLSALLRWSAEVPPVVLAVDTEAAPSELAEIVAAVESFGAKVVGILGVR